jgi:branched-chain amino acid transport system ATP-binding protein
VLLTVSHLTTAFGSLLAVNDVSLAVEEGEIVGLIGPNGAGTTTLLKTIAGVLPPNRGQIVFKRADITKLRVHQIARLGMARTFQLSRPFGELSVRENVLVGAWLRSRNSAEASALADRALDRVRFAARSSVPAHDLTAAERKRLDLARCLATEPDLLLIDEVIAGSTEGEMHEILETMRQLRAEGLAIVMVEHLVRAVMAVADRVVVMGNGRIVAEGTPAQVRRDPRAIEVYLGPDADEVVAGRGSVQV